MDEFFPRLPHQARLSTGYQERLQRGVERASRFPSGMGTPGSSGADQAGPWLVVDTSTFVFAKITVIPDGSYTGYSWRQKLPGPEGTWVTPDTMLYGDNGSETGLDRFAPAFGFNEADSFSVDDIVILARGYLHVSGANAAGLPLVDVAHPELGPMPDTEGLLGQEWLIVGAAGKGVCPNQTCPDGSTATDDCELVIVSTACSDDGTTKTRTTRRISIRNGKFHICTTTESLPVPPCPTQDMTGAFLLMGG